MRINREIMAVGVLLLIFIAGGLLLGGHQRSESRLVGSETYPDPSVYNDRPSGSMGLFQWTEALGYKPEVLHQGWKSLAGSKATTLLIIDPNLGDSSAELFGAGSSEQDHTLLSAADAILLKNWIQQGHTAILMSSSIPVSSHESGAAHKTFGDALDLWIDPAAKGVGSESDSSAQPMAFAPEQPTVDTDGVLSIRCSAGLQTGDSNSRSARVRKRGADGLALFGDQSGVFVMAVPMGAGRLIAIADGEFASNRNLPQADNALFLAHLLAHGARPGETVLFDEYHHGDAIAAAGQTVWGVLGESLHLALIQLALAFVVVCGVVAVRFGAPTPLLRGMTRTSAEYVTSLAGLYQRAGASTMALETIYHQFLRDVSARLGLASDVSLEKLVQAASRRGQIDKDEFRTLLATCESKVDGGKISESELLQIVDRMERIRKELGIG